MSKELFQLLQKGYFPKELPPAFNTYSFALTPLDLKGNIQPGWSDKYASLIKCSIPKNGIGRRFVHVVHPLPYFFLAQYVVDNYTEIKKVCKKSEISYSTPVNTQILKQRYFVAQSKNVATFQDARQKKSLDKYVELKVDISNYYPSIYTHVIPWAFVSKDVAKYIWDCRERGNMPSKYAPDVIHNYDIGAQIDKLFEKCQEKQTHGIPVGPDASFVVAEAILSHLDLDIKNKCPNLTGCRYYDDYYLYFDTKEEAMETLKVMIGVFNSFGLEINLSKVEINELPLSIMERYAIKLSHYDFNTGGKEQAILVYFEILWSLIKEKPNQIETILRYGLKALEKNVPELNEKEERRLHLLLLKTVLMAPSITPMVMDVLKKSKSQPDSELVGRITDAVFKKHLKLKHHIELLWALWMCKKYNLNINMSVIIELLNCDNSLCVLMTLDYLNNVKPHLLNCAGVSAIIEGICQSMNAETLYDERWILLYEGVIKGWLSKLQSIVDGNDFFSYLKQKGVSFYDDNVLANYGDASYIISSLLPLPKFHVKNAKAQTDRMLEKIKDEAVKENDDPFEIFDRDSEIIKIEGVIEDNNIENSLFDDLLHTIISGDEIDEAKIIKEYVKVVRDLNPY